MSAVQRPRAVTPARGRLPKHAHATLDMYIFSSNESLHLPLFLPCLFSYVIYLCGAPNKAVKKISEKVHFRRFDLLCVAFKGCWCHISKK